MLIIYHFGVGSIPELKVGVVNHRDCMLSYQNSSLCLFIDKLRNQNKVNLVPYSSTDQALMDTKAGQLAGLVVLPKNITNDSIDVYLDQTGYHTTWYLKMSALEAFKEFSTEINTTSEFIDIEPLFGPLQGDFKKSSFGSITFT
jgi:hypothetical protein